MTCLLLHYELTKCHTWLQCKDLISEDSKCWTGCFTTKRLQEKNNQQTNKQTLAATLDSISYNVEINPSRQAPTPCTEERFSHKPSSLENIYSTQSSDNAETPIFMSTFICKNWSKEWAPYLCSNWKAWSTNLQSNWKSKSEAKYCYLLFSISLQELKSQEKTINTLHHDL